MSNQPGSSQKFDTGLTIMGHPVLVDPTLAPDEWRLEPAKSGTLVETLDREMVRLNQYALMRELAAALSSQTIETILAEIKDEDSNALTIAFNALHENLARRL